MSKICRKRSDQKKIRCPAEYRLGCCITLLSIYVWYFRGNRWKSKFLFFGHSMVWLALPSSMADYDAQYAELKHGALLSYLILCALHSMAPQISGDLLGALCCKAKKVYWFCFLTDRTLIWCRGHSVPCLSWRVFFRLGTPEKASL